MKPNLFQRFIVTVLLLTITTLTWAYSFYENGIYYNKNSDGISVTVTYESTFYHSYSGSVTIPSQVTYNGETYDVTSIGYYAFYNCSSLTSVTIPNSVTSIGSMAFSGCSGLTSLKVEEGNPKYDSRNNCNAIIESSTNTLIAGCKTTTIPNSVTSIGNYAFYGCSGLTSVTIPNSVTSIGESAFSYCSGLTSVTIPNSVTSIGSSAFYECSGLTSVTIPNSVTSIESGAFDYCSGLTSIDIPNSVTSIGYAAFGNCKSLTTVTIPNSVTSIGEYAFSYCSGLTSIDIPNSVTNIRNSTFSNCSGLTSITIPNSVTSIGDHAFYGCSGLTSIDIPNSITSIGYDAFSATAWYNNQPDGLIYVGKVAYKYMGTMPSGTQITLEDGTLEIAGGAFSGCSGLTSVTMPNSITVIEDYAFSDCCSLTSVTIPNSVTNIGGYAFSNCSGLTSIDIPNSVTSIGVCAFDGCSSLTSITIPNSMTIIGMCAFCGCSGLTSITIPNSVISIGNYAFDGCSGLTSITIPNSVTSIENNAFRDCSGLTSIIIPNSVTRIGEYAFYGTAWYNNQPDGLVYAGKVAYNYKGTMPSGTNITLDEGTLGIADYAFQNCIGMTSVTIPNSVTNIGGYAFSNCSGLTSVTCLAKYILNTDTYAFFSSNQENATLYVPESAIEDYRTTAPWSSFGNIVALEAGASVANMRITDAGWATFWAPFAVDIPAGVKAYTGEMRDGWIRMIELTNGIIPGNTGVVLQLVDAEPFEIDLEPSATQPNEVVPSCYTGNTTGATMEVEVGDYLLQKNFNNERQEYVVGWYKVESPGFTLARNRCYLAKATVAELNQARPFLGFEPIDDATGISSIATEAKTKADGKYMVKGQVVVVKAGKAYNMNGTEIK